MIIYVSEEYLQSALNEFAGRLVIISEAKELYKLEIL